MKEEKKKLIALPRAAEMMGVSSQSLYAYVDAGKFKSAVKVHGTRWHIEQWEIDKFNEGKISVAGVYENWRR